MAGVPTDEAEIRARHNVEILDGVRFTSDLGSSFDDAIHMLSGFDYTAVGGNPWSNYPGELKQIHLEVLSDGGGTLAYNLSFDGVSDAFSDGYSTGVFDLNGKEIIGHRHGIDTIRVTTKAMIAGPINIHTLAGLLVHEMLHENKKINRLAEANFEKIKPEYPKVDFDEVIDFGGTKVTRRDAVLSSIEHIIIETKMTELAKVNDFGSYLLRSKNISEYIADLAYSLQTTPSAVKPLVQSKIVTQFSLARAVDWSKLAAALEQQAISKATALRDGASFRPDGTVDYWRGPDGEVHQTSAGSHYTQEMLDHYGLPGTARMSFGGHLRAIADLLGLDLQPGIQGTYHHVGEGNPANLNQETHVTPRSPLAPWTSPRPPERPDNQTSHWDDHDRPAEPHRGSEERDTSVPQNRSTPVLLDLDGNGISISALDKSARFVVDGEGLQHRTAWAGNGDGVLFIETDTLAGISNSHEFVFTEWDASADDDMAALRSAFDTNGDGKLTSADTRWGEFRVLRTNADGSTEVKTLGDLNITEINMRADTTHIELPDGSVIDGQATFVIGGVTRTAANVALVAEAMGAAVTDAVTDAGGVHSVTSTGRDASGARLLVVKSETTVSTGTTVNSWDMNGDGVYERVQRIVTVVDGGTGARTETVEEWHGATIAGGVKDSRTVTVTSADGKQVTISRDHDWGGWRSALASLH